MSDLTLLEVFILVLLLRVLLLIIFVDPLRDRGVVVMGRKLGSVKGFVEVGEVGLWRGVVGRLDVKEDGGGGSQGDWR